MDTEPNTASTQDKTIRVLFTWKGKELVVRLHDNAASRDLWAQLPLTLTFSDYASTEKVATLPRKLPTKGTPAGYNPEVGDLTYYAPWGNLAFFYKDFGYAAGLVSLGTIASGLKNLTALSGTVRVSKYAPSK